MPHIEVNQELCKGCGLCVVSCPKQVIQLSDNINAKGYNYSTQYKEGCIGCMMCADMCPDIAITVYKEVKTKGGKS